MEINDKVEITDYVTVHKYYCDSCGRLIKQLKEKEDRDYQYSQFESTTFIVTGGSSDNGFHLTRLICPECKSRIKDKIDLIFINEHLYDGSDTSNVTPCYVNKIQRDKENMQ